MIRTEASAGVVVDKEKVDPTLEVLSAIDWLDKALTTMLGHVRSSANLGLDEHQVIALDMVVKQCDARG